MKIQKIKFDKFKNLENIEVYCNLHNGLTVVIGNNASGKSNFLEALSYLFRSLLSDLNPELSAKSCYFIISLTLSAAS